MYLEFPLGEAGSTYVLPPGWNGPFLSLNEYS